MHSSPSLVFLNQPETFGMAAPLSLSSGTLLFNNEKGNNLYPSITSRECVRFRLAHQLALNLGSCKVFGHKVKDKGR